MIKLGTICILVPPAEAVFVGHLCTVIGANYCKPGPTPSGRQGGWGFYYDVRLAYNGSEWYAPPSNLRPIHDPDDSVTDRECSGCDERERV